MLKLRCITKSLKNEALTKRLENINFIKNLPRTNLEYNKKENELYMLNYAHDEELTIQYPGKETKSKTNPRPWDFRPKLKSNEFYMPDLSFGDIWIELYKIHEKLDKKTSEHIMKLIACEFYRMAFLIDYEEVVCKNFSIKCLQSNLITNYNYPNKVHIYKPNEYIINELNKIQPTILRFSWESFFAYNDLIALNEDCKYYYKKLIENFKNNENPEVEAKKYINKGVGRKNNLFTHIEFIRFMLTEPTFIDMISKFVNGRGVAPITKINLNKLLGEYLIKEDFYEL